jgi:nickel-dependent lactate racemase
VSAAGNCVEAIREEQATAMQRKTIPVRLGHGRVDLHLPESVTVLQPPEVAALADPGSGIRHALANPIDSASLDDVVAARQPRSVAIAVSDITRPVPNQILLPPVFASLNRQGIGDDQIVIIIATGMHRPSTIAERERMLGREIERRCEIIDHRADDLSSVREVCHVPPVRINRRFLDADFRIVTGLIEPHFMAGYSGGRKGICPGLADLATVQRFHGYRVMSDPRADNGVLDGNPCHEEALRVARIAGCDFLVNVAITHDRETAGVYCGDLETAHLAGCREVGRWSGVQVTTPFDLVVTNGGGYPLDATYYQTVKGMVSALPATHANSTLVVLSSCHEGVGSPEYGRLMQRWGRDWRNFIESIRNSENVEKDQWQMQMQVRALAKLGPDRVRLVCDGLPPETQEAMGIRPIAGDGDAVTRCRQFVDRYIKAHPHARVAVIPEGPYTMIQTRSGGVPPTGAGSSRGAS